MPRACRVLSDNARGGQPLLCPRLFSLYSRAILDGSCRRRTSAKVARHSLWQPSISPAGGRRRGHPLSWSRSRVEVLLHLLALMQRLFPGHSLAASLRTCLLKHLARPTCAATPGTTAGPPPVAAGAVGERSWSRPGNRLMRGGAKRLRSQVTTTRCARSIPVSSALLAPRPDAGPAH